MTSEELHYNLHLHIREKFLVFEGDFLVRYTNLVKNLVVIPFLLVYTLVYTIIIKQIIKRITL